MVWIRRREARVRTNEEEIDERTEALKDAIDDLIEKVERRSISIAAPLMMTIAIILTVFALGLFMREKFDQMESSLNELRSKVENSTRNSP